MSTVARPTEILPMLSDENAVIAIQSFRDDRFYVMAGSRLSSDNWLVKARPDGFAPVWRGVPRERAVKALSPFYTGEQITIWPGMWVDREDRRVLDHPTHFVPVEPH